MRSESGPSRFGNGPSVNPFSDDWTSWACPFHLGLPTFPQGCLLALLLEGVRSTEFCHCSGRPIVLQLSVSHIDPSTPTLCLFSSSPGAPTTVPSSPRHDAFQLRRAVLCLRRGRHENSQRQAADEPALLPISKTGRHPQQPSLPSLAVDWAAGAGRHLGCGVRAWPCGRTITGRGAFGLARVRGERASSTFCQIVQQRKWHRGPTREPTIDPGHRGSISTDPNGSSRTPQAPVSPPAECHLDLDGDGPRPSEPSDRQR